MDARGATTLHADEREQLLAVADALLFGDPDSEQGLARALDLIALLRESERWSAQSCDAAARAPLRLRTAPRGGLNKAAARVRPHGAPVCESRRDPSGVTRSGV